MPIKKKKISELEEANNLKGFFTIGYRFVDGVKESVKYGLEKIQNLYENLVKAISDAQEATTDVRQLEATVEANEEQRKATESQRVTSEQERKTSESERIASEFDRISSEEVREQSETARGVAEDERKTAESLRVNAEVNRVSELNAAMQISETATNLANVAATTANQSAITAEQSAINANEKAVHAVAAADNANDTANHPTYIGQDHHVYMWNKSTRVYDKTEVYVKGDPGTPFQVKGNYETLETLQTTIPDGSLVEGFIAIGASEPYDYYAWINDEWINQGKIAGEGGGKMVLIPSKVFNLTNTSSSSEILDFFGGKDAFIDIVKEVKENVVAAFTLYDSSYLILPQCLGKIDETLNQYQLEFTYLFPSNASLNSNMIVKFKDNVATVKKSPVMYNYVNFVEIPEAVMSFTTDTPSKQIESGFGGIDGFMSIVNKVCLGDAIAVLSTETGCYAGSYSGGTLKIDNYIAVDTLNLHIKFVANETLFSRIIKMEDGVFSCVAEQMALLFTNSLVSDPAMGGTDKPASAEAVKKMNDKMLTIDTEQDIVGVKNYEQGALRMRARLGGWANGLNLISNDKLNHICQFGFYGVNDNLNYAYIGREFDNPWVKVLPSGMLNVQNGMKTQNICIESSSDGATNATYGSEINNFNSHLYLQHKSSNNLMMCAGGGKVGIGNVTPQAMLHVEGDIMSSGFNGEGLTVIGSEATITRIKGQMPMALDAPVARYEVQWYNDYARFDVHRGGSSDIAKFSWKYNDTELANMLMNGNINTIGSVHAVGGFWKDSDARLKTGITPLRHTIEQILSIPTDKFLMDGKEQIGTIAQEVEKVCPEVVSESLVLKSELPKCDDWEIVTENDKEYVKVKRVEYEMLGVLALEGVKLLKAEIEDLKDELKRLKDGRD